MRPFRLIFAALVLTMFSTGAFAQLRLGLGGGFAFDSEAFTLFARGAYDINDRFRANATFNYYFLEDVEVLGDKYGLNAFDLNLDGHYTFAQLETISFYGLAGLNVIIAGSDLPEADNETDFGLNLGVGGLFGVADKIDILTEFKYTIGGAEQLFFNAGLLFNITGSR